MIASEKKTSSFGSNSSLQAASFSAYLNGSSAEESFMLKLTHTPQINVFSPKKKAEDGEIGVFGAEKYFKGVIEEELPRTPKINVVHEHLKNPELRKDKESFPAPKPKSQSGTPSVHSESSWNSRSGLLVSGGSRRERRSRTEKNGAIKSLLASLGCNCNDKASVKISDNRVHVKEAEKQPMKGGDPARKMVSLSSRWADEDVHGKKFEFNEMNMKKEDCFTFPVLNSSMADAKAEGEGEITVFGSPILEKGKKSFSLERKLTMLNWDGVTPRAENIDVSKNGVNNDTGSDASSDLFEIESFSTNENSLFLAQQASGYNNGRSSNVTNLNGYAPSEASIEWSVITDNNADFSVVPRHGDSRASKPYNTMLFQNVKAGGDMERVKGSGVLSGCKNLKAVRVAGDGHYAVSGGEKVAVTVGPIMKELCCRLDSDTPVAKFQADTRLMSTGLNSHRAQNGLGTARSFPTTHASHCLYIQQQ